MESVSGLRRSGARLVAVVLMLAGCSSGPSTIDALVQDTCAGAAIDRDPETVFAAAEAFCNDGRTITWFARTEDRDAWITLAESIAARSDSSFVILDRGRYHVVHTEDAALPLRRSESADTASGSGLDGLLERCRASDLDACVELYFSSPVGSDYEREALEAIPNDQFLDAFGEYLESGPGSQDGSGSSTPPEGDGLALVPGGEPYYGEVVLADPAATIVESLVAGGAVDRGLPSGCTGSVGTRPDFVLDVRTDAAAIELWATAEAGDLTLMVLTPGGRYLCDDDTLGFDPVVTIEQPERGRYRIWVGSYDGEYVDAMLRISGPDGI